MSPARLSSTTETVILHSITLAPEPANSGAHSQAASSVSRKFPRKPRLRHGGSASYARPHPSVAGVVRVDGQGGVGLLHPGHVVSCTLVKLKQGLQFFAHPRFVILRHCLVRTGVHCPDAI